MFCVIALALHSCCRLAKAALRPCSQGETMLRPADHRHRPAEVKPREPRAIRCPRRVGKEWEPLMDIRIESLIEGASRATGAVAVIDVFRAFTPAAVAFARGAREIIMVGTVAEALALRERGLGQVCMGEVGGRAPPGFDFGNSPFELSQVHLAGKTIIQRTGAGTQGLVAAKQAERLYAASLATAGATARALLAGRPDWITLVAMG